MTLKRKIDLITLFVFLIFCVLFYVTYASYNFSISTAESVSKTHQALFNIRKVLSNTIDIETGARGFIITGKDEFLEPLNHANQSIKPLIDSLQMLWIDDEQQWIRLDLLKRLVNKRQYLAQDGVQIRKTQGIDSAAHFILQGAGKRVMDSIRIIAKAMEEEELARLNSRTEKSKQDTVRSSNYLFFISMFVLCLFGFFYYVLRKNSSQLTKFNLALHETVQELNATNEEFQASQEMLQNNMDVLMNVQASLRESEARYRLISTNSKDLISMYAADENPVRVFVSPSSKDILGYEPTEMIGRSAFEFILPEDADRVRADAHPVTLSGNPAGIEYRARRKDGTIIWLESLSSPFFDEEGTMIGFQTSARDVTQRKIFEEKLVQAKEESERASDKLKILLGEKNDLIGLFSHDMRAPINQVKGIANIMSSFLGDEETLKDCISKLNQAVNRQLALYKDVLFMLKSDQVSFDVKSFSKVLLTKLISRVVKNLDVEIMNKQLSVIIEIPETVEVFVEPDLFSQALQNLLSNAVKFSNTNGSIHIGAIVATDTISIRLCDEGIGFDPSKAELLFERFTKEGRKGTNNEESTGLGLYLVRKIVESHNGKIKAHSDGEGFGSVFVIILPLS